MNGATAQRAAELSGFLLRAAAPAERALAVIALPMPDGASARALWRAGRGDALLFERLAPGVRWTVAGIGATRSWPAADAAASARGAAHLVADLATARVVRHPDAPVLLPLALGGWPFAAISATGAPWPGFGGAGLVLPRWTAIECSAGRALLLALDTRRAAPDPAALAAEWEQLARALAAPAAADEPAGRVVRVPGEAEYCALVEAARAEIAAGAFGKVVLARRTEVDAARPFDPLAVLDRLVAARDTAGAQEVAFAVSRGAKTFVGLTPEMLAERREDRIVTAAIAGTAPVCGDAALDARAAEALARDAKELAEHAFVRDGICLRLEALCERVAAAPAPRVLRLARLMHLHTPIEAIPRAGTTLLDVVAALHPTAAVGGQPRDAALDFIASREPTARGWYAAPVGWIDAAGEGAFAVAIRSALLDGPRAHVYAGAGIVAGSSPRAEFEETQSKMRAMLAALGVP